MPAKYIPKSQRVSNESYADFMARANKVYAKYGIKQAREIVARPLPTGEAPRVKPKPIPENPSLGLRFFHLVDRKGHYALVASWFLIAAWIMLGK